MVPICRISDPKSDILKLMISPDLSVKPTFCGFAIEIIRVSEMRISVFFIAVGIIWWMKFCLKLSVRKDN
jgi:hypothetical protein